jgi:2-polyprenyl-6-methoxyphenol hydroxylase-like FAD-dependent oxidoreductase
MDVAIAGAGIGGLTAALFLHAARLNVRVFEAAPELAELGVGVNIQPQAVGELARIGLDGALAAAGQPIREWALFNRFGQEIWREKRGDAAGHDRPQIAVHRGRLQGLLLAAVRQRLGEASVITDHTLVGFEEKDGQVVSRYATGGGGAKVQVVSDLLIGADGIHSATRRAFYPHEGPPIYAGTILWRGVTRGPAFLDGATMALAGYSGRKIIAYPITPPDAAGEVIINWIADIAAASMLNREDWDRAASIDGVLPLFEGWAFGWLDVPELLRRASAVYEYPMVDRDPLPQWSFGRTTLLGDAAHPMYPIGSNGASQAIRDAGALADALAAEPDPLAALKLYERHRREPTNRIVISNRGAGPETVMNLAHERAPDGFRHVHDVISAAELEAASRGYGVLTAAKPAS